MNKLVIRLSLALAAGIALTGLMLLAAPARATYQPPVPHPTEGRENCLACHEEGVGGAPQIPGDHTGRSNEMCTGCHVVEETSQPPQIPHTLEGRENCTACHVVAGSDDGGAQGGESPPIPEPITYPDPVEGANSCLDCHAALGGRSEDAVTGWQASIHAERDVICADCHGGDPNAEDADAAMSEEAGFIGKPDRADIPNLCGSCHANVELMRQYDLPTDQLAKYQESFHGQQLAEGDTKVATCFDCHDGHATLETNDPRASVYRLNVPQLCATCHADTAYMADYDLPTNQYDLYQDSVHGIALLERQDTRAPNCADCHGTHGATPPGFEEVSNVCGSCHSATQDYYLESAHNNSEAAEAPRCVTCHGRYDVQAPSEAMFQGSDPRECGSCHEADSAEGQQVDQLYQTLTDAADSIDEAESAVEEAARLGMLVAEEESLITQARTKLITARAAQHSVNVETVQAETEAAVQLADQARKDAASAIAENRSRRLAMIIALVVNALVIGSLVWVRRELVHKHD